MTRPRARWSDDSRALDALERSAPWVVFAIVLLLVVLSAFSALLGAPWWA